MVIVLPPLTMRRARTFCTKARKMDTGLTPLWR